MQNPNAHISEYLDYYLTLRNPQFSVLIAGDWGSGKTHFLKAYALEVAKRQPGTQVAYISLYGASSTQDIDSQILSQLAPTEKMRAGPGIRRLTNFLANASSKLFVGDSLSGLGTVAMLLPFFMKSDKHVLVFDDLERSLLSLRESMGYINRLVEHSGFRVICIANEIKLEASQARSANQDIDGELDSYRIVKEKLFAKTMTVAPAIREAISSFVAEIGDETARAHLSRHVRAIQETCDAASFANLRTLRSAVLEYGRVVPIIERKHRDNDEMMDLLLSQFLAYAIEIQRNAVHPNALHTIAPAHFRKHFNLNQDADAENAGTIAARHPHAQLDQPLIAEAIWERLFQDGVVDATELNAALQATPFYYDENTPAWRRILSIWDLDDDEFQALLRSVRLEYEQRVYESSGIVKHMSALFLWLSRRGLIGDEIDELVQDARSYADHLAARNCLGDEYDRFGRFADEDHFGHKQYLDGDSEEFKTLIGYFRERASSAREAALSGDGRALLVTMKEDTPRYVRQLLLTNSPDNIYCQRPILAHIEPADWVRILLELHPAAWQHVAAVFRRRYEFAQVASMLRSELAWLTEVRALLVLRLQGAEGKLSAFRIRSMIDNNIDFAINQLNQLDNAAADVIDE